MKRAFLAVLALGLCAASPPGRQAASYDLLFTNARVVDGTGAPWFVADVAVRGGSIAAVGKLAPAPAKRTIDATGLVVAPGFIDLLGQSEYSVLVDPRAASKITQGITTEVTGEGESIAPTDEKLIAENEDLYKKYGVRPDWRTLDQYFASLERRGTAINLATFVGSGGLRAMVVGRENRPATPEELRRMEALVDQAMKDGALGVSSSLQYIPNIYSTTEELVALAKVAARYGGAYFTHQRSESNRLDSSLEEVFTIAREAKIRAQIWHLKTAYKPNFGRMPEILKKIEDARAQGIDVAANQYPWNRASNGLDACLPPWVREGGRENLLKRLADPATRERVKADMAKETAEWENQWLGSGGADGVMVAEVLDPKLKRYEGKTIAAIAAEEKKDPRDAVVDIVLADRANANCIISIMDEKDVRAALAHPLVSFDTDSQAKATDGPLSHETAHPRGWGSAARILGYYVREEKVLRLEEAIRKMTSFAAEAAGLPGRGLVKEGFAADLTVFDPATVRSNATFETPTRYSEGFRYVAVNGVLVIDEGKLTGKKPGKALRGPGYKKMSKVQSPKSDGGREMNTREYYVECFKSEKPRFLRVLQAVPADKASYRPHEKSASASGLVWLLASELSDACKVVDHGELNFVMPPEPPVKDAVAAYEHNAAELEKRLASIDDAAWARKARFLVDGNVAWETSLGEMLWGFLFDAIHHRGQLSTYLRPMGAKVPSIYGPSADDPGM